MNVRDELFRNKDDAYNDFNRSLVPGAGKSIGVRIPVLRGMAKDICDGDWRGFLDRHQCEYMEELIIRGIVIAQAKMPFSEGADRIGSFVPLIDNWAMCDVFCTSWKIPRKEKSDAWNLVTSYMESGSEFGMRFAVVMMMAQFIDGEHIDAILGYVGSHDHPGYYYRMGAAWCVSVCYVKFPNETMTFLRDCPLEDFTYNKSLQKIVESYRVSDADKEVIRSMRRSKR
jgi:3-methyladenine DNA glycosylase AlkD